MIKTNNLFSGIAEHLGAEWVQRLAVGRNCRIERIVSHGHVSPEGFWYDQAWDEWVLLLQGQAIIGFAQDLPTLTLTPGDYCLLPAHVRHRVEWTAADVDTVWLAVHVGQT